MNKLTTCFSLFFLSLQLQASENILDRKTGSMFDAEAYFFESFSRTYPHLIKNSDSLSHIRERLAFSRENSDEQELWQTQKLIFDELEESWYEFSEPLRRYIVRTSEYGVHEYSEILLQLINISGHNEFPLILVPACGKFYESDTTVNLLRPEKVLAIDINHKDIESSRAMQRNSRTAYLHADLTKNIKDISVYDLVLFLHPAILDYDEIDGSNYFKYDEEHSIRIPKSNDIDWNHFVSDDWELIISNSLHRLKINGYAIFIFYSIEELEATKSWLSSYSNLIIKSHFINQRLVGTQFAQYLLNCLNHSCMKEAQRQVFGAYRAALIIQKLSDSSPSITKNSR